MTYLMGRRYKLPTAQEKMPSTKKYTRTKKGLLLSRDQEDISPNSLLPLILCLVHLQCELMWVIALALHDYYRSVRYEHLDEIKVETI